MHRTLSCVLAVAAACVPCDLLAQASRVSLLATDASQFPRVTAIFELRLPSGELAGSVATVRLVEGGRVVVGTVTPAGALDGVAYVLVIDASGTMKDVLPDVRQAVGAFIEGLGAKDRAAILAFGDDVAVVHPFTADRGALRANVEGLTADSKSTQLYLGVVKATEQLQAPGLPPRRVVVVISDGQDEGTAYTQDDAIAAVRKAGASVVALGITGGDPRFLHNLQRTADQTGGLFLRVEPGMDWQEKTALVARHVASRFSVTWASTLPADGRTHTVRLEVADGESAATGNLEVATPSVPWWHTRAAKGGGGAALALLLAVALVVWRARRRQRARESELKNALESEKQRRADVERQIGQGLEQVKGKLEELERQPAPAPAPPPPAPTPAAPPAKRRTAFVSGGGAAVSPTVYRTALLEVLDGPLAGSRLPLPPGRTSLGRDETNRVVVIDEKASSQHAVIVFEGGCCWLEDIGSTNGTFVEERRLTARWALTAGERIRLGGTTFRFHGEA
jgi:hypothetical protein